MDYGGFSGINKNDGGAGRLSSFPSQERPNSTQQTAEQQLIAAAGSNNNSQQGANLVQTKLAVIDGELMNSVQSNRSINGGD